MSDIEFASLPPARLKTDYLISGAGAMGMGFADVIRMQEPSAHITLVDRRPRPGGHWNDAYPFVALHQPAAFYGLSSAKLGTGGSDLASGPEIVSYYHRALQRMLASGKVTFLSQCDAQKTANGNGRVVSLLDNETTTDVEINKRYVDAGAMMVQVPATHKPSYDVAEGVNLIPLNRLPQVKKPWEKYVVIGAGKTGMDAILYLLDRGVSTERIRWVVSNDAWLWDRPSAQPGVGTELFLRHLHAIIEHDTVDEMFLALEKESITPRIHHDRMPTKWRCATIGPAELEALRTIDDVVRLGRVQAIDTDEIRLDQGNIATTPRTLHIDCTANGLKRLPPHPVFEGNRITLQPLVMCQQVFTTAVIARLTVAKNMTDEERNRMSRVVPHPEVKEDMPGCIVNTVSNMVDWTFRFPLWMRGCRVNLMHHDSLPKYIRELLEARKNLPAALKAMEKFTPIESAA